MTESLYARLLKRVPGSEQDLPPGVRDSVPANGLRIAGGSALQSSGDQTINASTVLPWLLDTLGAPTALIGLLVPIRESGSMLPQVFLTPWVLRARHRKWVVVTGALVQSGAVAAMSATAALGEGLAAGVLIVAALVVFSFGRSLTSIASKDVQGRTIPKGERGQINGLATTAAGLVAITVGVAIRVFVGEEAQPWQLSLLVGSGAVLWLLVALCFAGVREPDGEDSESDESGADERWFRQLVTVLRDDQQLRSFVLARSLLLVSALSPPFVVALSIESGAGSLAGLGSYVVASGLAALIGGRLFGRLADRSSRRVMSVGAAVASAIVVLTVAVVSVPGFEGNGRAGLFFVVVYFALTLTHTGVRVGRKTYVIDMAEGDTRTLYVAVSNSALGLVLLGVGALSSAIATMGVEWALIFLAVLGLCGVFAGARLPEVSRRSTRA